MIPKLRRYVFRHVCQVLMVNLFMTIAYRLQIINVLTISRGIFIVPIKISQAFFSFQNCYLALSKTNSWTHMHKSASRIFFFQSWYLQVLFCADQVVTKLSFQQYTMHISLHYQAQYIHGTKWLVSSLFFDGQKLDMSSHRIFGKYMRIYRDENEEI